LLLDTLSAARDLGRLHDIASVLIRHGLGDFVRRLGLAPAFERAGRALRWERMEGLDREPAVHLREALEELGPTFVKLGQLLAGRPDLLPPAWTAELSRLQEQACPVPFERIRAQLVEDLGAEPSAVFGDLERTPLAAASIAQVHRASLADGTPVVLKVRRPGVEQTVEADLHLLARLAERIEARVPELRRYHPRRLVRQFSRSLRSELDLRIEAQNAERLRRNLPAESSIVVPRIHADWTRERLCVMDFLPGPSIGQWSRSGRQPDVDTAALAAQGTEAILRMVFVDGCYHADPHPGNVILLPDGRVGLVDFGMVGFLSTARRLEFLELLHAVATRQVEAAVEVLLGWSDGDADLDLLSQDCAAFLDRYHQLPLKRLDVSALFGDLFTLLRENDLSLPGDVAGLLKVFVTLDGLGRLVDPEFVMATRVEPFARSAWDAQRSPGAVAQRGLSELGTLLARLPRDLRKTAARARRGQLRLEIDVERLDTFGQRVARSANRITMGLVTAALIVGTAVSLTVSGGPELLGLPAFGLLGFASSIATGLWLLWSIHRSGRP